MKRLSLILFILVVASMHPVLAQVRSGAIPFQGLIHSATRPVTFTRPIPSSAAFFGLDPLAVDRLTQGSERSIALEEFPITDRQQATLLLHRFEVLSREGSIVAGTENGDRPIDVEQGAFFHGEVEGMPGSYLYLAIFRDYCSGYIEIPAQGGSRRLSIAPLELRDGMPSVMVIYDEHEALEMQPEAFLRAGEWGCGAEHLEGYQQNVEKVFKNYSKAGKGKGVRAQSNTMLVAQIAIDCDSAYYVAHGRNLSRATNYALTVIGAVSAIYQRDVNVTLQVPYLRVWTGRDPYPGTSSSTLLPQFRTYWNTNMQGVGRTLAHMFSTSSIGGGIAYLNTLCANVNTGFGYAVSGLNNNVTYPTGTYVWDSDVTAHEMGHNFGSPHTHSCNWNPAIDSCYTSEGGCFSGTNPRVGTIMSYCHLTPFGTQLNFHPRVGAMVRSGAEAAACISPLDNSIANDVAVSSIAAPEPGGRIAVAANFTPSAVFRNAGTNNQAGLTVTFTMRDSTGAQLYTNSQTIASLPAGADVTVNFAPTSIAIVARCVSTVTITLAGDGLSANNTMVRPFETVSSVSGSLTLTAPNTAATYKAGSTVAITWNATGVSNARFDFTPDDGATWYTVATNITASIGTINWVVPPIATTRGRIRISDRDNASTTDASDQLFTITTLPLDWQWARAAGSMFEDDVHAVASDSRGNIYLAGTFGGTIWFDTVGLVATGASDAFVAKYNAGGTFQWARRLGGIGSDSALGVGVDGSGNVYVTGGFFNTMTFGVLTLNSAGDQDIFLAKYDENGTELWAQRGGGTGRDQARALAVETGGGALLTGCFTGSVQIGAQSLTSAGSTDIFITHLSSSGTVDWATRAGGTDIDEGNGIAVNASGECAVVGRYRGTAAFGGTNLTSAGSDDAFLVKLSATGAPQWAVTAGGSSADEGRGVAFDGGNNILATGGITGTVQFGTLYVASRGARDIYLAKYNSSGSLQWSRIFGGTGTDWGNNVVTDGAGNAYVAGNFQNTLLIGDMTVTGAGGSTDLFVAKYSATGDPVWAQRGGGTQDEEAYGLTINTGGDNAYLVGRFQYNPPSDPQSIYGADQLAGWGVRDLVIARLAMFRITSPVEGDRWQVGTNRSVSWSQMGATNVRVEYSADNGATWTTLATSAPNTGAFAFVVPNRVSQQMLIRVSDADNPSLYGAAQSGTFIIEPIAPPRNLVATPRDGSVGLTWMGSSSPGITGYAIYRGAPSGALSLLTSVNAAQLIYSDQTVVNCTDYVYAVKALVGSLESELSNLDTARPEAQKRIMALAPVTADRLQPSATKLVGWSSAGCIDEVRIQLSTDRGATWTEITAVAPNNGGFIWSVPAIASARAIIKISDRADSTVFGVTDTFAICGDNTSLTVTGSTTFCEGDSITLTAPEGYDAYLWTNGASTRSIVVKTAGTYSVLVADPNGCAATSQPVTVTVNSVLKPQVTSSGALAFCAGDSAILDAGAGFASYRWSTGDTTQRIHVGEAGSYWVRVTSSGGCSGVSDTMSVVVHAAPAKPVIASNQKKDSIFVTAPSGVIQWTLNGSPLTGVTARSFRISQLGTYRVMFVDSNGCSSISDTFRVDSIPVVSGVIVETGERGFAIHPNPTNGLFTIEAALDHQGPLTIVLADMAGKEIMTVTVPNASGIYRKEIDARKLPAGIYILDVHAGSQGWSRKIVKQ